MVHDMLQRTLCPGRRLGKTTISSSTCDRGRNLKKMRLSDKASDTRRQRRPRRGKRQISTLVTLTMGAIPSCRPRRIYFSPAAGTGNAGGETFSPSVASHIEQPKHQSILLREDGAVIMINERPFLHQTAAPGFSLQRLGARRLESTIPETTWISPSLQTIRLPLTAQSSLTIAGLTVNVTIVQPHNPHEAVQPHRRALLNSKLHRII